MKLSNDIDVSIIDSNCKTDLKRSNNGKIILSITCKCGKTKSTYELDNPKDALTERIHETLDSIKNRRYEPLPKSYTRNFNHYCNICGRQNSTSVKYTLTDKYFKRLKEYLNKATDKRIYKNLIQIETKLENAHFPNSYGDARDLLFAVCGSCLQTTPLTEPINYFENLCLAVKDIIKNDNYPEPKRFDLKIKCVHCLKPIEAKVTIAVKKPETAKELIETWESWKTQIISQPQQLQIQTVKV